MKTENSYDVAVIGAGHNGLTAAALLAAKGRKVLVLERRGFCGGLAAGETFHPGFKTAGLLHQTERVWPAVVEALSLERHELEVSPQRAGRLVLAAGGRGLYLDGRTGEPEKEIAAWSEKDAARYPAFRGFIERIAGFIDDGLSRPPPDLEAGGPGEAWPWVRTALGLRRLGRGAMEELLRIGPMCLADWLGEWFESGMLKAALAGPALWGDLAGPRTPGRGAGFLIREGIARGSVRGGPQALIRSLQQAAESRGVVIRTGCEVEEILISGGRVRGVSLAGGEVIEAGRVAASCDPRLTFLKLIPGGQLSLRLQRSIEHFRGRGAGAKVNLALRGPVEFACRPGKAVEFACTGQDPEQIERALDAARNGQYAEDPILEIHVPTVSGPELAPPGDSVVSIWVHYVPLKPVQLWDDERRQELGERVEKELARHAPQAVRAIVGRQVLSPADLAERYALVNGHAGHGDETLDQLLLRPAAECARYATPIAGLYLCGSGSFPGGGITCRPGYLAAATMLRQERG